MPKTLSLVATDEGFDLSHPELNDFDYYAKKHQKKKERKNRQRQDSGLTLSDVEPLNYSQRRVIESFNQGMNLVLHGCAGTGKTFLASYLAIRDVMDKVDGVQKVIIVRSVVPTRDMGFLPGTMTEKSKVYETPYQSLFSGMFNRGDAYDILKQKLKVEFTTTSFVRGETWDDAIIVVDEFQNMSFQELHSVITRVGENSRIVFCGDGKQDDLTSKRFNEESGIEKFINVLERMGGFDIINFQTCDIVRSNLVRDYLIACHELGY